LTAIQRMRYRWKMLVDKEGARCACEQLSRAKLAGAPCLMTTVVPREIVVVVDWSTL